jgi:hypothetical protein
MAAYTGRWGCGMCTCVDASDIQVCMHVAPVHRFTSEEHTTTAYGLCQSMRTRLLVCVRGFGAARARVDRAYVPVRRTCVQQLRGAAHVGICLFPYKHVCMPLPAYMYVGLMFV